jgi:glycosyltransferase involved in cell wall biosynthesis
MTRVTIIIPTYNAARTLVKCLESVVAQTFLDKEVLIIDGASTDNTLHIIQEYANRYDYIKWVSEKDKGIYDAMNKGIQMATGEWIYFLGSDDWLFDSKVLEWVFVGHQKNAQNSDFMYGNVLWGDTGIIYNGVFDIYRLYEQNICHQCIFVKKEVFVKKGTFELKYPVLADYYFNLLCFTDASLKKSYLNLIIAYFSLSGFSGNAQDTFLQDKKALFLSQLKKASLEIFYRFQIRYAPREKSIDKIKIIYYWGIYLILRLKNTVLKTLRH